ncbi:hypothetical protein I8920_00410 [Curtobacterium sp. YC1]|uniref:hypothetical protein n=1 Tax=Curtobacterium sp. YC1 TaxID=2795488 RepID=UPI0018E4FBCC|nr:hypothetical protein [Curtobacterium sp. YC1]QQD76281.1 hypothetical protein I8920_00410 [Curtobacterium sp. YC1]
MRSNELVLRTLVDAALGGTRRWDNAGDLAFEAGVPESSAYLTLNRLSSIGAATKYASGGFALVSVDKALTLLCAARNLEKDTLARTTVAGVQPFLDTAGGPYALGGPDAANVHLSGWHVSDFSEHLVYLPESRLAGADLPEGEEVRVIAMDRRAARKWTGYSSVAQTYADLFATPGWAASEFRIAMREKLLHEREWDQKDAHA